MAPSFPEPPALELRGIRKSFAGAPALVGADFEVARGEVHALLGENGAGKTTLMNVAAGLYRPDVGTVLRDGRPVAVRSPREARTLGIAMVPQHPRLSPRHSVVDNLLLGRPGGRLLPDRRALADEVAHRAESLGMPVDPSAPAGQLTVGEQSRVELLKALADDPSVLILDEPTAVLTPPEAERLFAVLARLRGEGRAVVLITHKLEEVLQASDRVSVMRCGSRLATVATRESSRRELVELMVGRDVDLGRPAAPAGAAGPVLLRAEGLSAANDRGLPALRDVSFELRSGEVLALAGVTGNGQVELAEVLYGLRPLTAGALTLPGTGPVASISPRACIDAGVSLIPADRRRTGTAPGLAIADNLLMKDYREPRYSTHGVLRPDAMAARARELVASFDVRCVGPAQPAGTLSGGNLQKVILARELSREPRVVVAVYPCRGLDVGSIEAVRAHLLAARDRGAAVLLVSEDLDEVLALGTRVAVMFEGRLLGPYDRGSLDRTAVGLLMAGARPERED